MPKLSFRTLAIGARQLVVQEALETKFMSFVYLSKLTPQTNIGVVVLGRSRHDDLLGTGSQMWAGSLLLSQEQAGGLDNILSAELAPGQIGGVAALQRWGSPCR